MRFIALVVTLLAAMVAASATLTNGIAVTHTETREVKVNGQWRVIKIVVVDRKTRQAVREMQVADKATRDYLHRGLTPTLREYGFATKAETLQEADGRYMPKTASTWDWGPLFVLFLALAAIILIGAIGTRRSRGRKVPA